MAGPQSLVKMQESSATIFIDKWPSVEQSISKILKQENVSKEEWVGMFINIHNIVLWDTGATTEGNTKVYIALKDRLIQYITEAQNRVLVPRSDEALLEAYISEWSRFFRYCSYLPFAFKSVSCTKNGTNATTSSNSSQSNKDPVITKPGGCTAHDDTGSAVRNLMLDLWNTHIFSNIKHRLQHSAVNLIERERRGDVIDANLVIGVRESFVTLSSHSDSKLSIYKEHFEDDYIKAAETFYLKHAPEELENRGVSNYMEYAEEKLREEEHRAIRYLETSQYCNSVENLMAKCVEVLGEKFKDQIMAEFPSSIKTNNTKQLRLTYTLLNRLSSNKGGVEPMLDEMEIHIKTEGLQGMHEAAEYIQASPEKYVEKLMDLFNRYSKQVKEAFNNDHRFLTARDKAYQYIVNDCSVFRLHMPTKAKSYAMGKDSVESRCPKLLASFCDLLLRKTVLSRRLTSEEIDVKLANVLNILKYVNNKDVFMKNHKTFLSRRLVLDISSDSEKEENMLTSLKDIGMPAEYIQDISVMFKDIKLSLDLNQEFKSNPHWSDSITIKILTSSAWARNSDKVPVSLPLELQDYGPEIKKFYTDKHHGRILTWHHITSNGVITFANDSGRYDLEVTTFQIAVLFAWNSRPKDKLSLESLELATQLPAPELKRTLMSLAAIPKLKRQILCHNSPRAITSINDIIESTLFWINQEFALIRNGKPQSRGKVNVIGTLQLFSEHTHDMEDCEAIVYLRIHRIQEAIVKILKMRKRVSHQQLVTELIEMLKNMFVPTKNMIKEQIEWLIEKCYMKRDKDDINLYIYIS